MIVLSLQGQEEERNNNYTGESFLSHSLFCPIMISLPPPLPSPQSSVFIVRVVDNRAVCREFNGSHGWHGSPKHGSCLSVVSDPMNHLLLCRAVELTDNALSATTIECIVTTISCTSIRMIVIVCVCGTSEWSALALC